MPRANPCMPCLLLAGNPGPRPSRLPNPGQLSMLGTVLEIKARDAATGQDKFHKFAGDGPNLYWSTAIKADRATGSILIFPRKHVRWTGRIGPGAQSFKAAGVEKAAMLVKTWYAGRDPTDVGGLTLSDYLMRPYGRALHIVYRSDKFSEKGDMEDYIHAFGPKVRMATAGGTPPHAMMITGGRLTVTERGLVY